MKSVHRDGHGRATLHLEPEGIDRLARLQDAFNRACNWLAGMARDHRCWSRVALHHIGYKALREAQPELGAQMACNAVYAVCRACLAVYMDPRQPWGPKARQPDPLPRLMFSPHAPVYLDRHTLTIKRDHASIYTLEGRLRCRLTIDSLDWERLNAEHVVQTTLQRHASDFHIDFQFETGLPARVRSRPREVSPADAELTHHLRIQPPAHPALSVGGPGTDAVQTG